MSIKLGTRLLISALFLALSFQTFAAQDQPGKQSAENQAYLDLAKSNPKDLVRRAVKNEDVAPAKPQYFMYRDVKRKNNDGVETREMLQTPAMVLGRLIAVNGKPLSPSALQKEDSRLQRLTSDPDALAKKRKQQHEDDQRAQEMVKALPDAFSYKYVGTEQAPSGMVVVLSFSPDPNYKPPNRELQVFSGMQGTMKIAVPQLRMALIEAKLFKSVEFGWGILGHLDEGGTFMIKQSEVYPPDYWDITHMKLHFTGKALIFKTLNIQQDEETSDYQPVPSMDVAQALSKLKEVNEQFARTASGGGK